MCDLYNWAFFKTNKLDILYKSVLYYLSQGESFFAGINFQGFS